MVTKSTILTAMGKVGDFFLLPENDYFSVTKTLAKSLSITFQTFHFILRSPFEDTRKRKSAFFCVHLSGPTTPEVPLMLMCTMLVGLTLIKYIEDGVNL